MRSDKRQKKLNWINTRLIISLIVILLALTIIIGSILVEISREKNKPHRNKPNKQQDYIEEQAFSKEVTAIIKEVNLDNSQIFVYDFNAKKEILFQYKGSSDIRNKFNQVISASQLPVGVAVDIVYQDNNMITALTISQKAWEYVGVKNLYIDKTTRKMTIADKTYKYLDDIIVIDQQDFKDIDTLAEQDIVTIWGFEEKIWSIIVNKGHGTVKLVDYENFIGGQVIVGYESPQEIGEDTEIVVREGNFNITVENGSYSVTKNILIERNKETIVTLAGLGPEATKVGLVKFNIFPKGADLYINDEMVFYDEPIELEYGKYDIRIEMTGYVEYEGKINVNVASKMVKVDLPEYIKEDAQTPTPKVDEKDDDLESEDEIDFEEIFNGEFEVDDEHYIYIQKPIGVSVYLNGEFMIASPGRFPKIIGKHVLTFIKENYQVKSYTIDVENDGLDKYISMPDLIKIN